MYRITQLSVCTE